jgi:hypothetical protein
MTGRRQQTLVRAPATAKARPSVGEQVEERGRAEGRRQTRRERGGNRRVHLLHLMFNMLRTLVLKLVRRLPQLLEFII